MKELSSLKHWNNIWSAHESGAIDTARVPWKQLHEIFFRHLPFHRPLKFLEIGCAPGRWMEYFRKMFGYTVHGIEYSVPGYEKCTAYLNLKKIEHNVLCQDAFEKNCFEGTMDMVFSMGFAEHFSDTKKVVKRHLDYLKGTGIVVVGVPNLKSPFYRGLQYSCGRDILARHLILGPSDIERAMHSFGVKKVFCGYAGLFNLGLVNWDETSRLTRGAVNKLNTAITYFLRRAGKDLESSMFSPYVLYIGVL